MGIHKDLEIRIKPDKVNRTLTIIDNGIGMTEADLQNLGSIYEYTIKNGKQALQSDSDFSECFYNAYLIAENVVVKTRHNDDKIRIMELKADGSVNTRSDTGQFLRSGTEITLHIRKDRTEYAEYLEIERIEKEVKNHFRSCRYPIKLWVGEEDYKELKWVEDDHADEKDIHKVPCISEEISVYSTFHGYKIRKANGGEMIKPGLRVLPLKSNRRLYELVKGGLGTICQVTTNGAVKVQWDLSKDITEFTKGPNGEYELLLFDNAQIEVKHTRVQCNGCNEYPLRGIRWKCSDCKNYDLCTKCYMDGKHDVGHSFKRIQSEMAIGEKMTARHLSKFSDAPGFEKEAIVQLRNNRTKVEHINVRCNVCKECPLRGIRWKSSKCEKYNLCQKCYLDEKHYVGHSFKRIESDRENYVKLNAKKITTTSEAQGNEKDVKVQIRNEVDRTDDASSVSYCSYTSFNIHSTLLQ